MTEERQSLPAPADAALVLENVSRQFRSGKRTVEALRGISARIPLGRITGLIGPDAAGKTTLMRLAAGLLRPDHGRIQVLGRDTAREALAIQAALGYMPQRFGLYEDLSVQENLDLYADLQGVVPEDRPSRYRELLHMTGLGPFTKRLAGRLSGGMKQKLGLACTLVRPPRLLLLDEPTVGVDPVSRRELWEIVERLVQDEGMSVLLSTAYLDEAERCQEVLLMHEGRLLDQGAPGEFSRRMQGHSFAVTSPALGRRPLQLALSTAPGVLDTVIQGDHVRLVTREARQPEADALLPGVPLEIVPVAPRFEDCFISLLKDQTQLANVAPHSPSKPAVQDRNGGENVIVVDGVTRRFGDFVAVRDIHFFVRRGEVFGLLGANGAGKSTTFRMLCGLLPPSAGRLNVAGEDLRTAAAEARARIGYVAQKFSLYADLSVEQNLQFFSRSYGLRASRRQQRVGWALKEFELAPLADQTSGELPLGYKRRLALAVALMHEPEIVFLDEPTSGVDPLARRDFWRRISELSAAGVTVLVTTHFMEEAEYCDRLAMMVQGTILAIGTPAEMKDRFRTAQRPNPTMEDAFIGFIEEHQEIGVAG